MPSSYKKNKTDFIRENLGGFQDNFTKEQKVAIIECLIIITNSDGEVHPYEMKYIKQTAKIIGIELDDPSFEIAINKGLHYITKVLKTLNAAQKDWFIAASYGMAMVDGILQEKEINYTLGICKDIGISEKMFEAVKEKTRVIMQKYDF